MGWKLLTVYAISSFLMQTAFLQLTVLWNILLSDATEMYILWTWPSGYMRTYRSKLLMVVVTYIWT